MEHEQFDDAGGFGATALMRLSQAFGHLLFQQHPGHLKGLRTVVVEQQVNVGNQLPDTLIDRKALAESGDQASRHGVSLIRLLLLVQADRADP